MSEIQPVAVPASADGSGFAVAPLPVAAPHEAERAATRGDERGRRLRRLLLAADVAALCASFGITQTVVPGVPSTSVLLLLLSIPLWVLLAYGHRLYYLDSYRADYGAADELGPVLQMATVWSWITLLGVELMRSGDVSIERVALFWILTVALLTSFRSVARSFARSQPWYLQDALVVGPPDETAMIVRKIERHPEWRIRATASGMPPEDRELTALIRQLGVDRVMLAPALS